MNWTLRLTISGLVVWFGAAPVGLAFYNSSTGRWLSRDPVESENPYTFVRNEGLSKWDVMGLWDSDVHERLTTQWARGLGINSRIAAMIGSADNEIDTIFNPKIISDYTWSWHFNRALSDDSRQDHKNQMVHFAEVACSVKNDDRQEAARYLGWALHPDQDWVAHGDYNRNRRGEAPTLVGVGLWESRWYWHNWGLGVWGNGSTSMPDDPRLDADGSADHGRPTFAALSGPHGGHHQLSNRDIVYWVTYQHGTHRINFTRERTERLLGEFQDYVFDHGGCRCLTAFWGLHMP